MSDPVDARLAAAGISRQYQEHVHTWQAPPLLTPGQKSRAEIEFSICGQVCRCGARRIYEGPVKGSREV